LKNLLTHGVQPRITCEQPFKKQKEHQEKMKSKDFNGQRRSTGQKKS
jgi:hypothetical protein